MCFCAAGPSMTDTLVTCISFLQKRPEPGSASQVLPLGPPRPCTPPSAGPALSSLRAGRAAAGGSSLGTGPAGCDCGDHRTPRPGSELVAVGCHNHAQAHANLGAWQALCDLKPWGPGPVGVAGLSPRSTDFVPKPAGSAWGLLPWGRASEKLQPAPGGRPPAPLSPPHLSSQPRLREQPSSAWTGTVVWTAPCNGLWAL